MKGTFSDGRMSYSLAKKALSGGYWVKRKVKRFYLFWDGKLMSSAGVEYTITSEDENDDNWSLVLGIYEVKNGDIWIEWHPKFEISG